MPDFKPLRRRIYIAGPISKGGLAHNVNQATDAFNVLMTLGYAPLCPHWSVFAGGCWRAGEPWYTAGDSDRVIAEADAQPTGATHAEWLAVDFAWMHCADAVLRLPGESVGADAEVVFARDRGIPVFTNMSELHHHFNREAK